MGLSLPVLREAPQGAPSVVRASPRAVRVSLTDRCDMACLYCRPSRTDGYFPAEERLEPEHWERLVRGLQAQGVRRVRLTGGEPLLFRGVVEVVERLASLGLEDLAMTTNGSRLAALAKPLRAAGLRRLTVSLDSLQEARFARLTRGARLEEVLEGVEAALAAGFDELKSNTVVLAGENEDELAALTQWAWARGITPRFLEVMGVGEGARYFRTHLVDARTMQARLALLLAEEEPSREHDRGPARYVRSRDGKHRVGFISGTSDTFCGDCDRLRVGSTGELRACLSRPEGVSVASLAREDALPEAERSRAVGEKLSLAWAGKPDASWRGCTEASAAAVNMRATGG